MSLCITVRTNLVKYFGTMPLLKICMLIIISAVFIVYVQSASFMGKTNEEIILSTQSEYKQDLKKEAINRQLKKLHTWVCETNKCIRKHYSVENDQEISTLETCEMLCSDPPLWPNPKKAIYKEKGFAVLSKNRIYFTSNAHSNVKLLLNNSVHLFLKNIPNYNDPWLENGFIDRIIINITIADNNNNTKLSLSTDESYKLSIQKVHDNINVDIKAQTYFGARHGLETLSQLIWYDDVYSLLKIVYGVDIEDSPSFPYRGVMIDIARNYFSPDQLKKILDGMGASKLNTLHIHATDSVSFPLVLPSLPQMASFGAYSPDMIYTPNDLQQLEFYANIRGIRLIVEVDAPSHVNRGWDFSDEKLVICGEDNVHNGQLNPDSEIALNVLEEIYSDLLYFNNQNEIFHIGSDEVNLTCWKTTEAAKGVANMKEFWANYTNLMLERLKVANKNSFPKNIVLWSSPLTASYINEINSDANITVQFWLGNPKNVLDSGHSIIYSTVGHWYLDCGYGPWNPQMKRGNCDPYTPWQHFYQYRPWIEYGHRDQALGGEVCLWSEQVEVDSLETRVWPRAAAFAERVWSDPVGFNDYDVYSRLVRQRERLVSRGLKAAGMWPRFCSQNPGKC